MIFMAEQSRWVTSLAINGVTLLVPVAQGHHDGDMCIDQLRSIFTYRLDSGRVHGGGIPVVTSAAFWYPRRIDQIRPLVEELMAGRASLTTALSGMLEVRLLK